MNLQITDGPVWKPEPHTPGPWSEFAESGDYWIAQVVEDGMPGKVVCDDSAGISGGDTNLICAAPELLAALIEIEVYHVEQNRIKGREESHSRTLRIARAAIAKARS